MPFSSWESTGWSDGEICARPPRRRATAPYERYTAAATLTTAVLREPDVIEKAREKLARQVESWTEANGYLIEEVHLSTDPPDMVTSTVQMRLEAKICPRMDGEWPAIRAAILEDAADRQAVAELATTPVLDAIATAADRYRSSLAIERFRDRMKALGDAAAIWSNPDTPEAW